MFAEREIQQSITNQLNNVNKEICCSAIGKIVSFDKEEGKFLVEINNKFLIKNSIVTKTILCKPYQEKYYKRPFNIGDVVFINFTDYNQNVSSAIIDVKKTKKHFQENGVILMNITAYNEENEDNNIIIGDKSLNTNIIGKNINMSADEGKIFIGNMKSSIHKILSDFIEKFNSTNLEIVAIPITGGPCEFNAKESQFGIEMQKEIDDVFLEEKDENN